MMRDLVQRSLEQRRRTRPPGCSFCGKDERWVEKLIAGPGVYICDECVALCNEIIDKERSC